MKVIIMDKRKGRLLKHEEVLDRLQKKGVQISKEKAPFGKVKNASMMIGNYRPVVINQKHSIMSRVANALKGYLWK